MSEPTTQREDEPEHREETRGADGGGVVPTLRRPLLKAIGAGAMLGGGVERALAWVPAGDSTGTRPVVDGETALAGAIATDGRQVAVGGRRATDGVGGGDHVAILHRTGGGWERESDLTPPERRSGFGHAVAVADGMALVGAPQAGDDDRRGVGAVHVYVRAETGWTHADRFDPANRSGMRGFGTTLALDDDTVLVGAPLASAGGRFTVGSVVAFERTGGGWRATSTVGPAEDLERFGTALALDGDTAVAGARRAEPVREVGVVSVLARSGGGWERAERLVPGTTGRDDGFGRAVAIDGGTVVVGAPTETNGAGDNAGAVYVFTRRSRGWQRTGRLLAPDGKSDDHFGTAVAIDGDTVLVGSTLGGDQQLDTGEAYVFDRHGTTWTCRSGSDGGGCSTQRDPVLAVRDGTAVSVGRQTAKRSAAVEVFDL